MKALEKGVKILDASYCKNLQWLLKHLPAQLTEGKHSCECKQECGSYTASGAKLGKSWLVGTAKKPAEISIPTCKCPKQRPHLLMKSWARTQGQAESTPTWWSFTAQRKKSGKSHPRVISPAAQEGLSQDQGKHFLSSDCTPQEIHPESYWWVPSDRWDLWLLGTAEPLADCF